MDMQVHAIQSRTATHTRPRLRSRSTCVDLPAFAVSKCFSFGPPSHIGFEPQNQNQLGFGFGGFGFETKNQNQFGLVLVVLVVAPV